VNDILIFEDSFKSIKSVSFGTKVSIHGIPSQNSENIFPKAASCSFVSLPFKTATVPTFSNNRWFVSKIIFKIAGCVITSVAIMASKFSNFPSTKVILSANLGSIAVIYLARKAVNVDR
jgi:hypothetical protein